MSNVFKDRDRRAALGLAFLGFLAFDFVLLNGLPGVELLPPGLRFGGWYLPFIAAGLTLLAAGLYLEYTSRRTWMARASSGPARAPALGQQAASSPFSGPSLIFERFLFANLYLTLFLALVVARLLVPFIDEPRTFRDTQLYVATAEKPLSDPSFWRAERSFTLPLVYKLLGVNTQNYEKRLALARVGNFQSTLGLASWAILGLSLASSLRSRWLRPAAFGLAAFFGLSLDLILWDRILLSESISNSLFALWIAGWIAVLAAWPSGGQHHPWRRLLLLAAFLIVTVLYTFARDTNVYLVLFATGLMLAALLLRSLRRLLAGAAAFRTEYLVLLVGLLLVYAAQSYTVSAGRRWQVPFYDILARRLLLDPRAVAYFQGRGMPIDVGVQALTAMQPFEYQQALRTNPRYASLRDWIEARGRSAYMGYLLSRPLDSLLQPLYDLDAMISPDLSEYRNPLIVTPRWENWLTRILYPHSTPLVLIVLGLLAAALVYWITHGRFRLVWLVPLVMGASLYPLMFIIWHGGTLELQRHAVQVALQARLAGWLMALFLLDFFVARSSKPPANLDSFSIK